MKKLSGSLSNPRRSLRNRISGRFRDLRNLTGTRKKMTVLVDSWGWIEYFNGSAPGEKVRELIENPKEKVIVSAINIAEVYNSFLRTGDPHFKGVKDVVYLGN